MNRSGLSDRTYGDGSPLRLSTSAMASPADPDTPCALHPAANASPRTPPHGPTMNRPSGLNAGHPWKVAATPAEATTGANALKLAANPPSTSQSGRAASGEETVTDRGSMLVPQFSNPPHSTRSLSPRAYTCTSGIRRHGSPPCHPGTGSVTKYSCSTGTTGISSPTHRPARDDHLLGRDPPRRSRAQHARPVPHLKINTRGVRGHRDPEVARR